MNKYKELVEAGAPELNNGYYYNISDDASQWGYKEPYVITLELRGRPTLAAWPLTKLTIYGAAEVCRKMVSAMVEGGYLPDGEVDPLLGSHGPDNA